MPRQSKQVTVTGTRGSSAVSQVHRHWQPFSEPFRRHGTRAELKQCMPAVGAIQISLGSRSAKLSVLLL